MSLADLFRPGPKRNQRSKYWIIQIVAAARLARKLATQRAERNL